MLLFIYIFFFSFFLCSIIHPTVVNRYTLIDWLIDARSLVKEELEDTTGVTRICVYGRRTDNTMANYSHDDDNKFTNNTSCCAIQQHKTSISKDYISVYFLLWWDNYLQHIFLACYQLCPLYQYWLYNIVLVITHHHVNLLWYWLYNIVLEIVIKYI